MSTLPLTKPLQRTDPPPETRARLSHYPWTKPYFTSPSYTPVSHSFLRPREPSNLESLLSRTLATKDTILAWQNFHSSTATTAQPHGHLVALIELGTGVNGHENVAHGGFVGVLLDEVVGMACEYQRDGRVLTMTAYLNVTYKAPVPTPGAILVRGWVERKEGRKIWARGTVEDGEGNVLSTGEALFVALKGQL